GLRCHFQLTAVGDLSSGGDGLPDGPGSLTPGPSTGQQEGAEQPQKRNGIRSRLAGHGMPLGVGYFMTENASDLRSRFRLFDEAGEKENRSARNREGIQLRVLDDKKAVIEGLRPHGGQYTLPNPIDIAFNFRISHEFELLPRFAPKFAADPNLLIFARPAYGGKNVFCNLRARAAAAYQ